MKLLNVKIRGFGCFTNREIEFTDGLNAILQENGYGKTTLIAFLRVMFYGFQNETKKAVVKERDARRPWHGGEYGGTVDFEIEGRRYRIDKSFAKRPADDRVKIYDLKTFAETDRFTDPVGKEVFGVDAETFLRTLLIEDGESATFVSDGVHSKLGDLIEDTVDVNRFDAAVTALRSAVTKLGDGRKTGELARLETRIADLTTDVTSIRPTEARLTESEERFRNAENEEKALAACEAELRRKMLVLSEYKAAEGRINAIEKLSEDLSARRSAFEEIGKAFPDGAPDRGEMKRIRDGIRRYESLSESGSAFTEEEEEEIRSLRQLLPAPITEEERRVIPEISEERQELKKQLEDLTDLKQKTARDDAKNKEKLKRSCVLFGILGGLTAIAAVPLLLIGINYGAALLIVTGAMVAAASAGLFSYMILALRRQKKERAEAAKEATDLSERIEQAERTLSERQNKLNAFFSRYGMEYRAERSTIDLMELFRASDRLDTYQEQIDKRKEKQKEAAKIREELDRFFTKVGIDQSVSYDTALEKLQENITNYENAEREFLIARKALSDAMKDGEPKRAVPPDFPETMEELSQAFEEVTEKKSACEKTLRELGENLESIRTRLDQLYEHQNELAEAVELRAVLRGKLSDYRKAEAMLTEAKQTLSETMTDPVTKRFRAYLAAILDRPSDAFHLNSDGRIVEEEGGSIHEIDLLSGGYRTLTYFALRLALIDEMYKKERPPILLDDSFQSLDREKLGRALSLLKTTAERYQILYFTCHESRTV